MNIIQRLGLRLLGKGLYDLHPELLERVPLLRSWGTSQGGELPELSSQQASRHYLGNVWVHKAIKTVADSIAPLGLEVVDRKSGEADERHPLAQLLAEPNQAYSMTTIWHQWAVDMQLHGESGMEFVRNRGREYRELWLRPALSFNVLAPKAAERRYKGVNGYQIDDGNGEPYTLDVTQFVHWMFANPDNPYRGLSPMSAVRRGVLLDEYSQSWALRLFKNSARPDYVAIAPMALTKAQREEIEAKLLSEYGGIDQAHKPIVLEAGDIKPLNWAPKDTEWLAQREMAREEIGAVYGVPDEIMGWGRDTYENFAQAERVFWRLTLLSLIHKRDEGLTIFFWRAGALDRRYEIATDVSGVDALQPDRSLLIDQAMKLWSMGVPLAEINDLLGLGLSDKLPGTDIGYLPMNLLPAAQVAEPPKPEPEPTPVVVMPPTPPAMPEPEAPQPEEELPKAVTKAVEYGSTAHKAMWQLFKASTEAREKGLKRIVKKLFQQEQDAMLPAVRDGKTDGLYDKAKWRKVWQKVTRPYWLETVRAGGDHGVQQTKMLRGFVTKQEIDWDLVLPGIIEAVDEMIWDFVDEVGEFTQSEIKRVITQSAEEGWSIPQLAEKLTETYQGFIGQRSERVARTETIKAYNYGALEGYKQEGADGKGWLSALDDRVRTSPESDFDHMAAHGEEVELDEPFVKTNEDLQFPGDPNGSPGNIIQCRCSVYPVVRGF